MVYRYSLMKRIIEFIYFSITILLSLQAKKIIAQQIVMHKEQQIAPVQELTALASSTKAAHLARFFKTSKGEYGEGDLFLGITVPQQRIVAKRWYLLEWHKLNQMIQSPYHEVRLTALMIIVERYLKKIEQQTCVEFYLKHLHYINNWDLVDLSCYKLLGDWLKNRDRSLLYELAQSNQLWHQRIAMVSCMAFIRTNDFEDTFRIAQLLIAHPHDLIHKAVGWLLREVGKRDKSKLIDFLALHYTTMPRTMLRYAIERFPQEERIAYLKSKI